MVDDDLVAFLRARLDEDAAAAEAATGGPWTDAGRREVIVEQLALSASVPAADLHMIAEMPVCADHPDRRVADAAHVARHDPARVLREVEAKQAILAAYEHALKRPRGDVAQAGQLLGLLLVCKHLAAVYRDHPDYDPDWAVRT